MPLVSPGFLLPHDTAEEYGYQSSFAFTQPALGATFSRITPGAFYEIPVLFTIGLLTSAIVAVRTVLFVIQDGDGNGIATIPAFQTQVASLSQGYTWTVSVGSAYAPSGVRQIMPLSPILMVPGFKLLIFVDNQQANDQLFAPAGTFQQFNTGIQLEDVQLGSPVQVEGLGSLSLPATVAAAAPPIAAAAPISTPTVTAAPAPAAPAPHLTAPRPTAPLPVAPAPAPSPAPGGNVIRE